MRKFIFKNTLPSVIVFLLTITLSSCSDDLSVKDSGLTPKENAITLCIPNVKGAAEFGVTRSDEYQRTRAEQENSVSEANIKSLWIYAFPYDENGNNPDNSRNVIAKSIISSPTDVAMGEEQYSTYTVEGFKNGNYKIYLLANLEDYLEDNILSENTQETTIASIALDFSNLSNSNNLQPGNLPMACLNTEVKNSDKTTVNNGIYNYQYSTDKNNTIVYADLTFLCSKVRYTILFDNSSEESFSSQFPSNNVDFKEEVEAKNTNKETKLIKPEISDASKLNSEVVALILNRVSYPEPNSKYLASEKSTEYFDDLPITSESWTNTTSKRAWQMIGYLPENIQTEKNNKTILTFKEAEGSELLNDIYTVSLIDFDNQSTSLERGKVYDIITQLITPDMVDVSTTFHVENWTTENLSYTLHGPYELIVETTEISVESGSPTMMWFRSDVAPGDIKFDYPKIPVTKNGETVFMNFYRAEVVKSTEILNGEQPFLTGSAATDYAVNANGDYIIKIVVNPEIPFIGVLELLNETGKTYPGPDGKSYTIDDVNYFHIVAGDLHKEIKVNPLNLKAILEVSPEEIIIDVKEYVESGLNSGEIDITYETNILNSDIELSIAGGSSIMQPGTLSLNKDGQLISNANYSITDKIGKLTLNFDQLFSGNSYWTKEHSYTLTFSIVGAESKTVNITVKPYTTDYVIHFHPDEGISEWTNPHVYIYQCLELPSDLLKDINDPEKGLSEYAGKTVGYYEFDNDTNPVAALEYLFSNNISFKGWKYYGGTVDPYGEYYEDETGFIHVGGKQSTLSFFRPQTGKTNYYSFSINLNSSHQENQANWVCDICRENYKDAEDFNKEYHEGNSYNMNIGGHIFAGVSMEKEFGEDGLHNGWYKYTLSGAATPGKCLIIFFDGHIWDDLPGSSNNDNAQKKNNERYHRFPSKLDGINDSAGIPLFDFPDNEGWLKFNGDGIDISQNFSSTLPSSNKEYVNIFLKGGAGNFDVKNYFRFYKDGENSWRTNVIEMKAPTWGIKITDDDYEDLDLGTNGSTLQVNVDYKPINVKKGGNDDGTDLHPLNIPFYDDFKGYVTLKKNGEDDYTIRLVSVP